MGNSFSRRKALADRLKVAELENNRLKDFIKDVEEKNRQMVEGVIKKESKLEKQILRFIVDEVKGLEFILNELLEIVKPFKGDEKSMRKALEEEVGEHSDFIHIILKDTLKEIKKGLKI